MESIGILGQPGGLQGFPVPVPRNPGAREHDVNAGLRLRVQAPGFFFIFRHGICVRNLGAREACLITTSGEAY